MVLGANGCRYWAQVRGTVLVSSQSYGVQERTVEVSEDGWELIDVVVVLQPPEAGTASLTVQVVDPQGRPVDGARIWLDDADLGRTSTGGTLSVRDLAPGLRRLKVERARMTSVSPIELLLSAGVHERVVEMAWLEGQVDVLVRTPQGPVDDATIRFVGPEALSPQRVNAEGRLSASLKPGTWTTLVTSEAYGAQQRSLNVQPGPGSLYVVEFDLVPAEGGLADLSLLVVGPKGQPVDGADVRLDELAVGSTSNAGWLELQQLRVGPRVLSITAPRFGPAELAVELTAGDQEREVQLAWSVGAVAVQVVQQGEPVQDAILRFLGPERRVPMPVDAQGRSVTELGPGRWTVLATSESQGAAERTILVPPSPGLTEVELELTPPSLAAADLALRVVDPLGQPVEGATVSLDGVALPRSTNAGGLVVARGVAVGRRTVAVVAKHYRAVGQLALDLEAGLVEQVVELDWVPTTLTVRTQLSDGTPVVARVQPEAGPADIAAVQTDDSGRATLSVPPGEWRVIATAGERVAEVVQPVTLGQAASSLTLVLEEGGAKLARRSVEISERVQFDFNKATLRPDSEPVLDSVARVIRSEPRIIRIEVQGHTDNVGTVAVNQRLSQLRAEAVVAALTARGVAREKLVPVGYGRSRPRAPSDTVAGRAENRRVQFELLETADP